jgi:hypothetical protein
MAAKKMAENIYWQWRNVNIESEISSWQCQCGNGSESSAKYQYCGENICVSANGEAYVK